MKLEVNEDNIELFKMTLWLNLFIGIYGKQSLVRKFFFSEKLKKGIK